MILFLEYRWLVKPIVRMAAVLQHRARTGPGANSTAYAPRRDEIGAFAQALIRHFQLVQRQQQLASQQQQGLSDRLARQEDFRRESLSFQARIAEIVQRLEGSRRPHVGGVGKPRLDFLRSRRARGGVGAVDPARVRTCRRGRDARSAILRRRSPKWWARPSARRRSRPRRAQPRRGSEERRQRADRSGAHDRAGDRTDRGRRQSDQSPGAQRHHRSRARGRDGARIRRRRA